MSTENQTAQVATAPKEKIQVTTREIRELMLGGMNRKEIAAHYGCNVSIINKFFNHPDLADLRPKHKSNFELVDDSGATFSPGALAQAKKEAKEAEVEETEEVSETPAPQVSESTGI